MKKKIIGIFLILMILLFSNVNAAIITATPELIKKDSNVEIKILTDTDVYGMQFTLTYDSEKFQYVTNSAEGVAVINSTTPGTLVVSYTSQTAVDTLSFTFKALLEGTVDFKVSDDAIFTDAEGITISNETFDTKTKSVTVELEAVENLPTTGIGIEIYIILLVIALIIIGVKIKKR